MDIEVIMRRLYNPPLWDVYIKTDYRVSWYMYWPALLNLTAYDIISPSSWVLGSSRLANAWRALYNLLVTSSDGSLHFSCISGTFFLINLPKHTAAPASHSFWLDRTSPLMKLNVLIAMIRSCPLSTRLAISTKGSIAPPWTISLEKYKHERQGRRMWQWIINTGHW